MGESELRTKAEAWLDALQLPNISGRELLVKVDNSGNSVPPEELWPRIVFTAHVVQQVRTYFGRPVILHSTYRSTVYNESVGGASQSRHLEFNAIDFHVDGIEPAELASRLDAFRSAGVFRGGIGLYSWGCHVDTRGYNADF